VFALIGASLNQVCRLSVSEWLLSGCNFDRPVLADC